MNNELATRIFDDVFDDDDLNKMHRSKIIAQPLGFKLSCIATIEVAIDEHCDRLTEENAKLREALRSAIESVKNGDKSIIGNIDFLPFIKADLLLNQLKDKTNDK